MANKDIFYCGLAGLGTVGGGLVELLKQNREWIKHRTGKDIVIKKVLELEHNKERVEATGCAFTSNMNDLVNDPEIDMVVELVGGTTFARELMTAALNGGKHVVTANKALLAEHGDTLFPLAAEKGLHLGYEASVAGGIPTVQTLKEALAANRIEKLMGILNGTANFILTQMTQTGMSFDDALQQAQDLGYAEADPTLDIEGWDTAHKLVLLIQLAFGEYYPLSELPVWGVSIVHTDDIAYADKLGFQIKLLASARKVGDKIEAGVFPALVPQDMLLANVQGSFNAIRLEGNAGPILLYGHGAGDLPTASAVMADIIQAAMGREANNTGFQHDFAPTAKILDLDEAVSRHYLRLNVPDQPGVLRDIGGFLAEQDVSLAQVIQKGYDEGKGQGVPLVFLTHEAPAKNIHEAMNAIREAGLPLGKIVHYRII